MGSQIIGWAKNDPIYDSFHGNSENIVSHCKGTKEITHIMKSTSAVRILTKFAKAY